MNNIEAALIEMIAQRTADIVIERWGTGADPGQYEPTRRLSRKEAARHLGVSVRTLDARVASGDVWKYQPAGQKPFYIIGELDGRLPVGSMRKSASGVAVRPRAAARTKPRPLAVEFVDFQQIMGVLLDCVTDCVPKRLYLPYAERFRHTRLHEVERVRGIHHTRTSEHRVH